MKVNKLKWLVVLMAVVMMSTMAPTMVSAFVDENVVGNYGFIPNSGEASVSKVNLETGVTVAKYYTAPRLGDNIDFMGNTVIEANTVPPYAWRTSRIAMDKDGNAWVLNVGADAFLNTYPNNPPSNYSSYRTYNQANTDTYGLVGSVVRIQANVDGLTTNADHSNPMTFGSDEAVQVFPVGAKGELPRAITIDGNNNIWIGFYGGEYFQKYVLDGTGLVPVGAKVEGDFTPYEAKIDDDGILWFSSRAANPTVSTTQGVFWFDTKMDVPTVNHVTLGANPYSILIGDGVVWATALNGNLYKIQSGIVTQIPISGANGLRGLSFDSNGLIWIASSSNNRVSWYNPAGGGNGTSNEILAGAVPVGVGGPDADGYMWAICRYDNNPAGFMARFKPTTDLPLEFRNTFVGFRPYAYGDFTQTVTPTYDICGFKYVELEAYDGWTIYLDRWVPDVGDAVGYWDLDFKTAVTGAGDFEVGQYCFNDLLEGIYRVREAQVPGWIQTCPDDVTNYTKEMGFYYLVTLPNREMDTSYDFCNVPEMEKRCETAWATEVMYIDNDQKVAISNENWALPGTGKAWGWNIGKVGRVVDFELWAAAGQNNLASGVQVGEGRIEYNGNQVCVYFTMLDGFDFENVHLWVGNTNLPKTRRGYTAAPGQFNYNNVDAWDFEDGEYSICLDASGDVYVALHLETCWYVPVID